MKFAYILNDKVSLVVEAESIDELLPLDKKWSNLIDLSAFDPQPDYGWEFKDNVFTNPNTNEVAGVAVNKKITKLALLNRFTPTELATYETALASSIPLKVLDKKLFAASFIDLDRADTIAGINYLVPSILTSERASEILNAIPTETELYKG